MPAGYELISFNDNLEDTQENLQEVKGFVHEAVEKAEKVEEVLDTFKDIADQADFVGNIMSTLKVGAQLIGKVGFLAPISKALVTALDKMKGAANAVEKKALAIDKKLEPIKKKVEDAREKLEEYEQEIDDAAIELASYQASGQSVEYALDLLPRGSFTDGLSTGVDIVVTPPNIAVEGVNSAYDYTKSQVQAINNAIDVGTLNLALELKADFAKITSKISFLKKPLEAVAAVLKPVQWALDAVQFIFDNTVGVVLYPILKATGLQKVFDNVTDSFLSLLPNVSLLTGPEKAIDKALSVLIPDVGLDEKLGIGDLSSEARAFLEDALGDARFLIGSDGRDTLTGDSSDNIISGGGGNDTLVGNGGNDVFIGGKGNDTITGDGTDNRAVFTGSLIEYLIEFSEDGRTVTVTHDKPADPLNSDGRDVVTDVEIFAFSDVELSRTDLQSGVQVMQASDNGTLTGQPGDERDFLFAIGQTNSVTLDGGAGDDHMIGGSGSDSIIGGAGDDVLDGGVAGTDFLDGGEGDDTATFASRTGGEGERIKLDSSNPVALNNTANLISIENLIGSDKDDIFLGRDNATYLERLSGEDGDDILRGYGGDDRLEGGDGDDLLIGDGGSNEILGGNGSDVVIAGLGTNDVIDGGDDDGYDVIDYGTSFAPIVDTFDNSGLVENGWAVEGVSNLLYQSTGGNGGGRIRANDDGSGASAPVMRFVAPDRYTGDQSDKVGGTLSFDIFHGTPSAGSVLNDIIIMGDGEMLVYDIATYRIGWQRYDISLDASASWRIINSTDEANLDDRGFAATQADIDRILGDVVDLVIRADNVGDTNESTYLDNVILSSLPVARTISSNFEDSTEGWRTVGDPDAGELIDDPTVMVNQPTFDNTGSGVGGGSIRSTDNVGPHTDYFAAPDKFLGDQSDKFGGTLEFAYTQYQSGAQSSAAREVVLSGGGLKLGLHTALPSNTNWTAINVALESGGGWDVIDANGAFVRDATDQDVQDVLAELDGIFILADFISGTESVGLDSVSLRGPEFATPETQEQIATIIGQSPLGDFGGSINVDVDAGEVVKLDATGQIIGTDEVTNFEAFIGTGRSDVFFAELADASDEVTIKGGDGDDVFVEGEGAQKLFGQGGNDTFVINSDVFEAGEVFHGGDGVDTLDLRGVLDTRWTINTTNEGGNSDILLGVSPEADFPDAAGISGQAQISSIEVIHTGEFDDRVASGTAVQINTYAGDDFVQASFSVENEVIDTGDGDDTVENFAQFTPKAFILGKGNDTITTFGGNGADLVSIVAGLTGYEPAEDESYTDDDLIEIGAGAARIDGGDGVDMVSYGNAAISFGAPLIINLATGATGGVATDHELISIEGISGTIQADNITGDDKSNLLVGYRGNDTIFGGGSTATSELEEQAGDTLFGNRGVDNLYGEAGDDLLHGGQGGDFLFGGDGSDTASYVFRQEHPDGRQLAAEIIGTVDADLSAGSPEAIFTNVLVSEDFEGGAAGWDDAGFSGNGNNTTDTTAALGEFLVVDYNGSYADMIKTFDLGDHTGPVTLTFDAIEFDGWANAPMTIATDDGTIFIRFTNGVPNATSGGSSTGNATWSILSTSPAADLGRGSDDDFVHRIEVNFTPAGRFTDILIGPDTSTGTPVLGVDNLVITGVTETDFLSGIENLIGGNLDDRLIGDDQNNSLSGNSGNDILIGNAGDDQILDGAGIDTVDAGAGDDIVVAGDGGFNGVEHAGDNYDGGSGGETEGDLIDFGGISGNVIVDQDAGTVTKTYQVEKYVWADGGGTEAREFDLRFSELNGIPNLRPKDIAEALDADLINSGDDAERDFSRIEGEVADLITTVTETVTVTDTIANFERLAGSRGDDFFYATAGADDFDAGDEEVDTSLPPEEQVVPAADTISFERSTSGIAADIVNNAFSGGFSTGGSYVGFANVIGTNFDDTIVGDERDNFIEVKDGTNSVSAGGGNDDVRSFDGVQLIDLGDGDDKYINGFIGSPTGISVTVYGRDGTDDILAFGNEILIDGGDGNDELYAIGLDSTDTDNKVVNGGAGDDLVRIEGAGIDAFGGEGNDTIWSYTGNGGPLVIDLQNQTVTGGAAAGSTINGFENITASGSASVQGTLTGTNADNVIRVEDGGFQMFGLDGNDTLIGNNFDDVFDGGDGIDTAVFAGDNSVDVSLVTGLAFGQAVGTDTLVDIENVTGGTQVDLLEGNDQANVLDGGNSSTDTLRGRGGDDTLILRQSGLAEGGAGNDRIELTEGFELGRTTAIGGDDTDTLVINSDIDLTIDLTEDFQTAGDSTEVFRVSEIENIATGNGNNTITGQAGASIINTGEGDDVIRGDAGDELLALQLNVPGQAGRYGVVTDISMPTNALTLEMLYKGDGAIPSGAIAQTFFSYSAPDTNPPTSGVNHNEILVYGYENGSSNEVEGDFLEISFSGTRIVTDIETSRLTDGEQHRLSITFVAATPDQTGRIELYIDGERLFVHEADYAPIESGGTLIVGQEQDSEGGTFDTNQDLRGYVTDIRVFEDVRTAAEIAQNAGQPIADPASEAGLVHDWSPVSGFGMPNRASGDDMTAFGQFVDDQLKTDASSGDDTINAGGGDDWVDGGGGADTLDGGDGEDTLSYETSRSGVTVDLANSVITGGSATGDTVIGFENIIGSNFDDIIISDGNLLSMTGLFGDDALLGSALDETIDAGAGDDYVLGGAGADTLIGGLGVDTLGYSTSTAAVSIDLSNSTASGGHAEGDTISSFENIIGSGYNDFLFGNSVANDLSGGVGDDELRGGAGNDTLDGGDGADRLNGGLGNDFMRGGAGNDIYIVDSEGDVIVEDAGGGDDIVYATFNYELPVNVEVLIVLGERAFEATGSSERNFLFGGDKNDIINGAGGADYMEGGKGDDVYAVDESSDAIVERAGEGNDAVYSSVDYIIDSAQEIETAILTGNATVLRGDDSANQLFGNDGVNVIDGRGGPDYMLGLGGADIFQIGPDNGSVDVIGDFSQTEGDRIAFAGFGEGAFVTQVSAVSFEVSSADGSTVQQFQLYTTGGEVLNPLVEGQDYYFG